MNTSIVITAFVAGIVTWLFMYLDARLFDSPKSKFTYVKGIVFVSAISALIVYFMGGNKTQMGGAPSVSMGTSVVHGIGEEILTGMPNF